MTVRSTQTLRTSVSHSTRQDYRNFGDDMSLNWIRQYGEIVGRNRVYPFHVFPDGPLIGWKFGSGYPCLTAWNITISC